MTALEHFIGKWKSSVSVTEPDGSTREYETRNEFKRTLDGEFVEDRACSDDASIQHLGVWRYDPASEQYYSWYFMSPGGQVVTFAYRWDESEKALIGEAPLGESMKMSARYAVVDSEHHTWEITVVDGSGKTLSTMKGNQERIS